MIGYSQEKPTTLTNSFWSGVLGGMTTRVAICPLDVIKIRFQLQANQTGSQLKYNSIPQAAKLILREEGVTAFWKGHTPAQMLSIIYGGVQFMSFQYFTQVVHKMYPTEDNILAKSSVHLACGSLAGSVGSVCAHPVDVLRTRFAAQKEPKTYTSVFGATKGILTNEGWRAFFKGLTPSLVQVAPQTGVSFASYSLLSNIWLNTISDHNSFSHFFCGAFSGLISKTVIYPMDLIKKRLQVQGFGESTVSNVVRYKSVRHCAQIIYKTEGLRGFYKGWTAAALKSCLTVGLIFFTYELFSDFFRESLEDPFEKCD